MGQLLTIQPENNEPVNMTHFDKWFEGNDVDSEIAFFNADAEAKAKVLDEVARNFGETLGADINPLADGFDNLEQMINAVGFDTTMDILAYRILQAGYDVYVGNDFIEVYRPMPLEQEKKHKAPSTEIKQLQEIFAIANRVLLDEGMVTETTYMGSYEVIGDKQLHRFAHMDASGKADEIDCLHVIVSQDGKYVTMLNPEHYKPKIGQGQIGQSQHQQNSNRSKENPEKRIVHAPDTHPDEWKGRKYMGEDGYTMHLDSGGAFDYWFELQEINNAPTVKEGQFSGTILKVTENYAVQKVGRDPDKVVSHLLSKLSQKVTEGDVLDIKYASGRGEVVSKKHSIER